MTEEPSGARRNEDRGTRLSEDRAGAAFLRDRSAGLRRATSPRARHVWTGAVALAVTGGVLVSASASVPVAGTAVSDAAASSTAASGNTAADAGRSPAGPGAPVPAGHTTPAGTAGITVRQVLAVLDRAERRLRQSPSLSPRVAQAAAELGMLYATYQVQQLALADADERSWPSTVAPAVSRPDTEHGDPHYVTFDEVAVAAMRLANMLDPTSPTALVETLPGAESSLRRSLLETVAAYGDSTAGYANGRIPADVLCPLPFAPGHMLRCDAAERLTALSAEFEKEFGYPIPLTDSYRPYSMQVAVKETKPHLAAIPGTSNHGWGLAIDLDDPIADGSSPEYVWLRLHGPDYGWDNPSWARPGGAKPEPWHFEFFAAGPIPNRAINPADVDTWGPPGPAGRTSPDVLPAATQRPATSRPAAGSTDGSATSRSQGDAGPDGAAPASGSGPSTAPAEPTPAEPAPSEPHDPGATDPADPGLVDGALTDAVDGVVQGLVGGLLGGYATATDSSNASATNSADSY